MRWCSNFCDQPTERQNNNFERRKRRDGLPSARAEEARDSSFFDKTARPRMILLWGGTESRLRPDRIDRQVDVCMDEASACSCLADLPTIEIITQGAPAVNQPKTRAIGP